MFNFLNMPRTFQKIYFFPRLLLQFSSLPMQHVKRASKVILYMSLFLLVFLVFSTDEIVSWCLGSALVNVTRVWLRRRVRWLMRFVPECASGTMDGDCWVTGWAVGRKKRIKARGMTCSFLFGSRGHNLKAWKR